MVIRKPKFSRKSYLELEVSVAGRPPEKHSVYIGHDIFMDVNYTHTEQ